MKRVLITGENSYIGMSVENWLNKWPEDFHVDTISVRDGSWKSYDFSSYDSVFHVAGIVHIKETAENNTLYYSVNRDLAFNVAKQAKSSGVKQFIFLSSMSVYGIETGVITCDTPANPITFYGKSKLQAEELIESLSDESFSVATLRPPMVYGPGCKGNYPRLARLAKSIPFFPDYPNQRSMLYIDHLSEFIKQLIESMSGGLFFPQNSSYVNTSDMAKVIASVHGKKLRVTKHFNFLIRLLNLSVINKVFGNLVYDMSMSNDTSKYRVRDFEESIRITEQVKEKSI